MWSQWLTMQPGEVMNTQGAPCVHPSKVVARFLRVPDESLSASVPKRRTRVASWVASSAA